MLVPMGELSDRSDPSDRSDKSDESDRSDASDPSDGPSGRIPQEAGAVPRPVNYSALFRAVANRFDALALIGYTKNIPFRYPFALF